MEPIKTDKPIGEDLESVEARDGEPQQPLATDVPLENTSPFTEERHEGMPSQGTLPLQPDTPPQETPSPIEDVTSAADVAPVIAGLPPIHEIRPAGFVRRFIAFLIDFVVLGFLYLIVSLFGFLGIFLSRGWDFSSDLMEPFGAIWFVLVIGYFTFFHAQSGQTPAKRIIRIKVVNKEGVLLSHGNALLRSMGYLLSFGFLGGLGFLISIFGKHKRALHDFITGSYVVLSAD
ncbi:MAG: RDD family protein [Nitrospirota bacterium]